MAGGEPPDHVAALATDIDAWDGFALDVANAWRVLEHGVEAAAAGAIRCASRAGGVGSRSHQARRSSDLTSTSSTEMPDATPHATPISGPG